MCSSAQCIWALSLITIVKFQLSIQYCPEEVSTSDIRVTWYQSSTANYIRSDPLCIHNGTLVTRNCTNDEWLPLLSEVLPCNTAPQYFDPLSCAPGFKTISDKSRFCYYLEDPAPWDYPCFQSGGATVITELNKTESEILLNNLEATGYKYFWLPGQRHKTFVPIVWLTPGPNWGRNVITDYILPIQVSIFENCLLLDISSRMLVSGSCSNEYPSLCLYNNDINNSGICPTNYHAYRYERGDDRCFGIEKSDIQLSFQEFLNDKCKTPMGNSLNEELRRNLYSMIATTYGLPSDTWCWFATPRTNFYNNNSPPNQQLNSSLEIDFNLTNEFKVINKYGSIALMDSLSTLPCMACEAHMIHGETELNFEYDEENKQLVLTVYYPSGLWKYNANDKGIQCFSDADGFSTVIDVNEIPHMDDIYSESSDFSNYSKVEKSIYVVSLVTERSARYWCEGHTKTFSLISTEKIVVNPQGNQVHVFSLVLKTKVNLYETYDIYSIRSQLTQNLTSIFKAEKALVMDILEYNLEIMQVLIHLHMTINITYEQRSRNLQESFEYLKLTAEVEFPKFNYIFVNLSSAVYCLPATSITDILLSWEITPIGHIAAPLQFCVQANGVPVNRQCHGSYLFGSFWGEVEGQCDISYSPTVITTFLFDFIKRNSDQVAHFLTTGIKFVLEDLNILIPADIYYLSLSFQHILSLGRTNISRIETGDINNMAWIMDRMMSINCSNLRLAQTLNSTNAILESTSDIIELITVKHISVLINETVNDVYQLAVKPQFIVQVSYPMLSNVTGIAIIKNSDSDSFTDMTIKPLYMNSTLQDVLLMKNLEVATWLPNYLVHNLQKKNNDTDLISNSSSCMHIVIKVYNNNAVFQELHENKLVVNSRILEVTVPDYIQNFDYPLPLIFRQINDIGLPKACGYWDFQTENGNIPGSWSRQGCYLTTTTENFTICECYHLTHFAQLLDFRNDINAENSPITDNHDNALNIITLIGSFLSISGIVGIWITATVFDSWRKKTGTKVLLQLSISIALPLILIIVFNLDNSIFVQSQGLYYVPKNMVPTCISLGVLFHYSILANFMWMLITAILQFIRYVQVLGISKPSRFTIKLAIFGWGLPCIPVMIILFVDCENYVPDPSTGRSFCYPNGIVMIGAVIVPVCVVLLINIILFLLVIKSISRSKFMQTDKCLIFAQFRVSIFLFFLLGLTWIFGVASFTGQMIWSYLFCLTSTLQGFVLFIYFVICDPNTRNMWITVMKAPSPRSKFSLSTISNG